MCAASTCAESKHLDGLKIPTKSFGCAPRACAWPFAPPTLRRWCLRFATRDAPERGLDSYPTSLPLVAA
jgi:hypothetical protein